MDISEENVQSLLGMGFFDEASIRQALVLAKNDLNEAVSYLTCELPMSTYDVINDIDMNEEQDKGTMTSAPPSYEETCRNNSSTYLPANCDGDFPYEYLVELEGRVYSENWSIPFRNDESLAKCLIASTNLIEKKGIEDLDENCRRFLHPCMTECFNKLLNSNAVTKWLQDVHEGIFNMLQLFTDLIIARLKYDPIPLSMLDILSQAFDPDCAWNIKNKFRSSQEELSETVIYARMPGKDETSLLRFSESRGWMIHIINQFCAKGGMDMLQTILNRNSHLDATQFSAILKPFSVCVDYLNPATVVDKLAPLIEASMTYVKELSDEDFKVKKLSSLSELLQAMKSVCMVLWTKDVSIVDDLRLEVTLRMMKCPHFNAKMNALKEVTKLIEECQSYSTKKTSIEHEKVLDWLVDNTVLSISLDGHTDQSQYCDKIQKVVEFIGEKLSCEELTQLWKLQNNATLAVSENIQLIISGAVPQFNEQQIDLLFSLIQEYWLHGDSKYQKQLVSFIGRLGHNSKCEGDIEKVLDLLWELAHLPKLSPHLVELALHEHNSILSDSFLIKESMKKKYILRCIEDIKKDTWVVPALKQMHDMSKTIVKSQYKLNKSDRGFLFDLNRSQELTKLIVTSLARCHKVSVVSAFQQNTELKGNLVIFERYMHSDYVWWHLNFLKFLLKEGDLYISWNKAKEIWDTLVFNKNACEEDRETCCNWFTQILSDLEHDAVKTMFREKICKVDLSQMSLYMFDCFIEFMKHTNTYNQKMKKTQGTWIVEKLDLHGIEILWRICLDCVSNKVAHKAVTILVWYSCVDVSQKLKKDMVALHSKFLKECYKRLNNCYNDGGDKVSNAVNLAKKIVAANITPDISTSAYPKGSKYLMIERLLFIVHQYIVEIESSQADPRILLPHGEFFRGSPIYIQVKFDSSKEEFFTEMHSNETVYSIRKMISKVLEISVDHLQLFLNDRILSFNTNKQLLFMSGFSEYQEIFVKTTSSIVPMQIEEDLNIKNNVLLQEMEKKLPSVVLSNLGIYDILFHLTDLDQPQITASVRKLLLLLPTDSRIKKKIKGCHNMGLSDISENGNGDDEGMVIDGDSSNRKERLFNSLFCLSSSDMNLFRLRYNLEVLSGLLMPVKSDQEDANDEETERFLHSFLQNGGMQVILGVLQKEIISSDDFGNVDTRRGCFTVVLKIAKFLLCVASHPESSNRDGYENKQLSISSEAAVSPLKRDSLRVGSLEISATPTKRNRKSISQSPVVMKSEIDDIVRTVIQTLSNEEFSSLLTTLIQTTWYSSACKLDQLTSSVESVEGTSFLRTRKFSRESTSSTSHHLSPYRKASTSSMSSCGSTDATETIFNAKCEEIRNADSVICRQSLELLVHCLKLRSSHLEFFFDLPYVEEFVIDVLTKPNDTEVRDCAVNYFYELSTIPTVMNKSPRQRMVQLVMKARLPYWHQTTRIRAKLQMLGYNCLQYFKLRGKLIQDVIKNSKQKSCGIDEVQNLNDEVTWLISYDCSPQIDHNSSLTDILLTGHLGLIKILISSPLINKKLIGSRLIGPLLSEFLFPASKLILNASGHSGTQNLTTSFYPKCSTEDSRLAAFDVLVELCRNNIDNLNQVVSQLISMHHYSDQSRAKEYDFSPLVVDRIKQGFVGLKNGGATCYMNSILQQLFMVNDISQAILATEFEDISDVEKTLFYQVQKVFAHLLNSQLQFFEPSTFWKTFRLWGQEVNIREHQDAFEFFTDLTDQIDEYLKSNGNEKIFQNTFQGLFSDQKICEGCPHKYEREEPYFALCLPIKSGSLEDSLKQFVAGEKLEGDNAYFCEKCNQKRTAIKRTCIKTLPPVLVIQLKRFGYDWEQGRSLKFDHLFKFPHQVDMQPYLSETPPKTCKFARHTSVEQQMYKLVGVVVHSGQVQAGHYYAIIKDRRGTQISNPSHGQWFKFNDNKIEEFEMNDENLENECFGGTFTSKVYERGIPYDEERLRYWNAYLLFYEKVEAEIISRGKVVFKKQVQVFNSGFSSPEISPPSSPKMLTKNDIRLSQLTHLVKKGEKQGIFSPQIPASIMQLVNEENLEFMKNQGMYSSSYFNFIRRLVEANLPFMSSYPAIAVTSLQISTRFLFQTYFRSKSDLLTDCDEWRNCLVTLLDSSLPACVWFMSQLHTSSGFSNVTSFLLECPNEFVRSTFGNILSKALSCLIQPNIAKEQRKSGFEPVISRLYSLLDREVAESIRRSKQFFTLLTEFNANGAVACECTLRHNGFEKLMKFLLGEDATKCLFEEPVKNGGSGDAPIFAKCSEEDQMINRRWSSTQSRDFLPLHSAIANIILHSDLSSLQRDGEERVLKHTSTVPKNIVCSRKFPLSHNVEQVINGRLTKRYIKELLFASREITSSLTIVSNIILHCSFENPTFSTLVSNSILNEIQTVAANELRPILAVLLEFLSLSDCLQPIRLSEIMVKLNGNLLGAIELYQKEDESKCYQCVKAVVQLSSRSKVIKDFLLGISSKWSWSVAWLKRKMTERTWSTSQNLSMTSQSNRSNEAATTKHFQRTMSAQHTLEEATALLAATNQEPALPEENTLM